MFALRYVAGFLETIPNVGAVCLGQRSHFVLIAWPGSQDFKCTALTINDQIKNCIRHLDSGTPLGIPQLQITTIRKPAEDGR